MLECSIDHSIDIITRDRTCFATIPPQRTEQNNLRLCIHMVISVRLMFVFSMTSDVGNG